MQFHMLTRKRASDAESIHTKRARQVLDSDGSGERGSEGAARPPAPPHDVLESIFEFLSFRGRLVASRVSRQWNHVAALGTCHDRAVICFDLPKLHTLTRSKICRRHIHRLKHKRYVDVRAIHSLGYLGLFSQLHELDLDMERDVVEHPRMHTLIAQLKNLRSIRASVEMTLNTKFVRALLVPGFQLTCLEQVGSLYLDDILVATSLIQQLSTYLPGITELDLKMPESDPAWVNELSFAQFHSLACIELTCYGAHTEVTDRAFRAMPRESLIHFKLHGFNGSESLRDWLATVPNLSTVEFQKTGAIVDFSQFAHAQLETFYTYPCSCVDVTPWESWLTTKSPRLANNPRMLLGYP